MKKERIIYILIGPPAIGKSTWIKNHTDSKNTIVINRDNIVEEVASTYGWTYNDMFVQPPDDAEIGEVDEKYGEVIPAPEYMYWRKSVFSKVSEGNDRVLKIFKQSMEDAKASDKNVVVDLTNMRVRDRIDGLNKMARPNDTRIAVVFNFKGKEKVIKAVATKRAEAAERMGKTKDIPDIVIDKMISGYESPTPEEGYDKIIYSDTIPQLKKFAGLKEIRQLIREKINLLFEEMKPQSKFLSKDENYGSYEGIVHYDMEKVINWFANRKIDHIKYLKFLELPIAFLNNINVEEKYRGKGYGDKLYFDFEDACYDAEAKCIILECDMGESQITGFHLQQWYESLDFETIGVEGGNPIMIKYLL